MPMILTCVCGCFHDQLEGKAVSFTRMVYKRDKDSPRLLPRVGQARQQWSRLRVEAGALLAGRSGPLPKRGQLPWESTPHTLKAS